MNETPKPAQGAILPQWALGVAVGALSPPPASP